MKKYKLLGKKFKQRARLAELKYMFDLCISGKCNHGHKPGNPIAMFDDGTLVEYTDHLKPGILGVEATTICIDDPFKDGWTADARL